MATVTTSQQGRVSTVEFLKSAGMTVASAVIDAALQTLQSGSLAFDWKQIGITALITLLVTIGHYLQSATSITIKATKDDIQAVKSGDATVTVVTGENSSSY